MSVYKSVYSQLDSVPCNSQESVDVFCLFWALFSMMIEVLQSWDGRNWQIIWDHEQNAKSHQQTWNDYIWHNWNSLNWQPKTRYIWYIGTPGFSGSAKFHNQQIFQHINWWNPQKLRIENEMPSRQETGRCKFFGKDVLEELCIDWNWLAPKIAHVMLKIDLLRIADAVESIIFHGSCRSS